MNQTPRFQCSLHTRALADFLIKHAATNDTETVLSYAQLSKVSMVDVLAKRHVLQSARRICLRECNAWFVTINQMGVKLATPLEASAEGEHGRQSIVRNAQASLRRMAAAKYEHLTEQGKISHNVNASVLGAVCLVNQAKNRKRIEGAVINSNSKIDTQSLLRLFQQNGD
jgi:hypothetical protein